MHICTLTDARAARFLPLPRGGDERVVFRCSTGDGAGAVLAFPRGGAHALEADEYALCAYRAAVNYPLLLAVLGQGAVKVFDYPDLALDDGARLWVLGDRPRVYEPAERVAAAPWLARAALAAVYRFPAANTLDFETADGWRRLIVHDELLLVDALGGPDGTGPASPLVAATDACDPLRLGTREVFRDVIGKVPPVAPAAREVAYA